jgi:hypothetical protein
VQEVRSAEELIRTKRVDQCLLCGCGYLYLEKDFNGWVGLGVILAAVGGFLWLVETSMFLAMGILLGAAAIDFGVYRLVPHRTICYQCCAAYRGTRDNPAHGGYELGIAGRFTDDYENEHRRQSRARQG